jgi:GAF domain-containing protein
MALLENQHDDFAERPQSQGEKEDPVQGRLNFIVRQAASLAGGAAAIWTRREHAARIRAASGILPDLISALEIPLDRPSPLADALRTGVRREIFEANLIGDPLLGAAWTKSGWSCLLVLPIEIDDEVTAALTVFCLHRQTLEAWDKTSSLIDLAQQVGVALMEEIRQRLFHKLNEYGAAFPAEPRLAPVLTHVLDHGRRVFSAQTATMYPRSECPLCRTPVGDVPDVLSVDDQALLAQRMVVANKDLMFEGEWRQTPSSAESRGARRWFACTMAVDHRVEVVMFMESQRPMLRANEDIIRLFASRAALGLRTAQVFEESSRRAAAERITQEISGFRSIDEALSALERGVQSLLDAARATLFGPGGPEPAEGPIGQFLKETGPIGEQSLWHQAGRGRRWERRHDHGTVIAFPIAIPGRGKSLLLAVAKEGAHFHPSEVVAMGGLVAQATALFERIHLGQLRSKLLAAMAIVNDATTGILSLDIVGRRVLKEIVKELSRGSVGSGGRESAFASLQLVNRERGTIEAIDGINARWSTEVVCRIGDSDIQALVVRRGKAIAVEGWHDNFNRTLFEKYGHADLVRFFLPIRYRDVVFGTVEAGWYKTKAPKNWRRWQDRLETILGELAEDLWRCTLPHALEVVINRAIDLLGAHSGSVHMSPLEDGTYALQAWAGCIDRDFLEVYPPGKQGIGRKCLETQSMQYIDDPKELANTHKSVFYLKGLTSKDPIRYPAGRGVRAIACFPLAAKEPYRGVFYVHFWETHTFSKGEFEILDLFAAQATKAMTMAHAYEKVHDHQRALTGFALIGESVTGEFRPARLLAEIARSARRVLKADVVIIYGYDATDDRFDAPPIWDGDLWFRNRMQTDVKREDTPWRIVHEHRDSFYAPIARDSDLFDNPARRKGPRRKEPSFVRREEIQSAAGIPLQADREIVGVMFVNYRSPQDFVDKDRRLIETFGSYAAIAIRNAREAVRKMVDQMRAIQAVDLRVSPNLEMDRVFQHIADKCLEHLHVPDGYATVQIYNRRTDELEIRASQGLHRGETVPNMPIGKGGITALVAKTRAPIVVPDSRLDRRYLRVHRSMRSEIAVPLLQGGRLIGVLNVESSRVNAFGNEDLEFLVSLATNAALAIHGAEFGRQLDELWKVLARIREERKVPSILKQIAASTISVAAADDALIVPYDHGSEQFQVDSSVFATAEDFRYLANVSRSGFKEAERTAAALLGRKDSEPLVEHIGERRTTVWLPLRAFGQRVGIIRVGYGRHHEPAQTELTIIRAFAEQAAVAVAMARDLQEQQVGMRVEAISTLGLDYLHNASKRLVPVKLLLKSILDAYEEGDGGRLLSYVTKIPLELPRVQALLDAYANIRKAPNRVPRRVDVRTLMKKIGEEAVREVQRSRAEIGVRLKLSDDRCVAAVDVDGLLVTVESLVSNAIDAMPHGGLITLSVRRSRDLNAIVVQVGDTGIGMTDETKAQCFAPFFSAKEMHVGLGLFVCRVAVRKMGGTIDVESVNGEGSIFTIRLPVNFEERGTSNSMLPHRDDSHNARRNDRGNLGRRRRRVIC